MIRLPPFSPHVLAAVALSALAAACSETPNDANDEVVSSEIRGRTDGRRARLAALANVDAVARLYVGHELTRSDLLALGAKPEKVVLDSLAARPDFRARHAARIADFRATEGAHRPAEAPESPAATPPELLVDAFDGDERDAERFASWLARTVAPLTAEAVIAEHHASFKRMTYRELLDAIRSKSQRDGR